MINIVFLQSIQNKRAPYESEISEEVLKEFLCQEEEKRSMVPIDHGRDIAEVQKHVSGLDDIVMRLEGKMDIRMQRLEDLLSNLANIQSNPRESTLASVTHPSLLDPMTETPSLPLQSKNVVAVQEDVALMPIQVEDNHWSKVDCEKLGATEFPNEVSIVGKDYIVEGIIKHGVVATSSHEITEIVQNADFEVVRKDVEKDDDDVYDIEGLSTYPKSTKEGADGKDPQPTKEVKNIVNIVSCKCVVLGQPLSRLCWWICFCFTPSLVLCLGRVVDMRKVVYSHFPCKKVFIQKHEGNIAKLVCKCGLQMFALRRKSVKVEVFCASYRVIRILK